MLWSLLCSTITDSVVCTTVCGDIPPTKVKMKAYSVFLITLILNPVLPAIFIEQKMFFFQKPHLFIQKDDNLGIA